MRILQKVSSHLNFEWISTWNQTQASISSNKIHNYEKKYYERLLCKSPSNGMELYKKLNIIMQL